MPLTLTFLNGPLSGKTLTLPPGDYIVGRRTDSHVHIADEDVSRQHSRIYCEAGSWFIEDLGSQNGTYVNGHKVQQLELSDGDLLRLSSHRIRVGRDAQRAAVESEVTVADTVAEAMAPLYLSDEDLTEFVEKDERDAAFLARQLQALSDILEASATSLEPDALLAAIVDKLLEVFPRADAVGVLTEDETTGKLRVRCHRQRAGAPGPPQSRLSVPGTIIKHVVEHRQGILLGDTTTEAGTPVPSSRGVTGSRMGAPLKAHNANYGVLYVNCSDGGFRPEDVDLLTSIAAQAGLALHAARMHQQLLDRQRIERDVRVARQIQRSLLPKSPPEVHGIDIAAHYEAAYQIGGDFYDFIWHDSQQLAFVVGDVSGKSISAALYMARLTGELRSRTGIARTPRRLLRQVNEALVELGGPDGMFATLVYAIYDFKRRALLFSNAGHMPPLLRRRGRVATLHSESAHAHPLGIVPDLDVGQAMVQLQPGDLLVMATDGVHEARDPQGVEYGELRLSHCVQRARGSAADVIEAILRDVSSHSGAGVQRDDVTIVAVTIGNEPARRRGGTLDEEFAGASPARWRDTQEARMARARSPSPPPPPDDDSGKTPR